MALGLVALGLVALGLVALGLVALGLVALGLVALGSVGLGLVAFVSVYESGHSAFAIQFLAFGLAAMTVFGPLTL